MLSLSIMKTCSRMHLNLQKLTLLIVEFGDKFLLVKLIHYRGRFVKEKRAIIVALILFAAFSVTILLTGFRINAKAKLEAHIWKLVDNEGYVSIREYKTDGSLIATDKYTDGSEYVRRGTRSVDDDNVLRYKYENESAKYKTFEELNESDIDKGLVDLSDSKWYVSDKYHDFMVQFIKLIR